MRSVYFDESGNTGDWLLDPQQPFFALAGVCFSPEEEAAAFECFKSVQLTELKFTKLRKSSNSQKAVRKFLEKDFVSRNTAGGYIVEQPHMVITKYCDLVLEPSIRATGANFYENGMNIALSNMLAMTMPVVAGAEMWRGFLNSFIKCVRSREAKDFLDWRTFTRQLWEKLCAAGQEDFAVYLVPVLELRSSTQLFRTIMKDEMNPALPSFVVLLDYWGQTLADRFEAVCDESKALDEQRDLLEGLSDLQNRTAVVGYDRRKMRFPLPMSVLRFADSKIEKQIQLADVVAGCLACGLRAKRIGDHQGFEFDMLQVVAEKGLVVDGMWASADISPESLGTVAA